MGERGTLLEVEVEVVRGVGRASSGSVDSIERACIDLEGESGIEEFELDER